MSQFETAKRDHRGCAWRSFDSWPYNWNLKQNCICKHCSTVCCSSANAHHPSICKAVTTAYTVVPHPGHSGHTTAGTISPTTPTTPDWSVFSPMFSFSNHFCLSCWLLLCLYGQCPVTNVQFYSSPYWKRTDDWKPLFWDYFYALFRLFPQDENPVHTLRSGVIRNSRKLPVRHSSDTGSKQHGNGNVYRLHTEYTHTNTRALATKLQFPFPHGPGMSNNMRKCESRALWYDNKSGQKNKTTLNPQTNACRDMVWIESFISQKHTVLRFRWLA